MLKSRRLYPVTRVFPQLFCRPISVYRVAEKASAASPSFPSSLQLSLDASSSAGESFSESEDAEESGGAPSQVHQIQVLRAYLRNRRARCLSRVREAGLVPAVIVDPDKDRRFKDGSNTDTFISLDAKPLSTILKLIGKRDFVSRVFDMEIYHSPSSSQLRESLQVLPRNLNYGSGKTNILNIQFMRALPGETMKLGVPLEFLGIDQCPGLMKGGTLKKLAKYVVYNCEASELPAKIVVDMSVLEIGDRVLVQDLEVNFDHLYSDRMMAVCEIVKDVSTLKAKARKLKTEIHYKRRALAEKESRARAQLLTDDEVEFSDKTPRGASRPRRVRDDEKAQANSLTDNEVDVSDDDEDEVIPYRYQKSRALAAAKKAGARTVSGEPNAARLSSRRAGEKAKAKTSGGFDELRKGVKPSKRRLAGAAFVKLKLDEQVGKKKAASKVEKHRNVKDLDSEDDDSPRFAKNQASARNMVSGGESARRGKREQRSVALSPKKYMDSDDSDMEDVKME